MLDLLLAAAPTAPTGVWPTIITWVQSFIHNYGWTIILITVVLKLILMPIDYWMKVSQKKMTLCQNVVKPEIDAIQKKYAYDKNILNQKQSEVYKKHGINPMGSCLPVLLNLVLVFTFFISLVNSLTIIANYNIQDQFYQLNYVYEQTITEGMADGEFESRDSAEAIAAGQQAVIDAYEANYNGVKNQFLWIKNIWRKDTYESVIPSYEDAKDIINKGLSEEDENYVSAAQYENVMSGLIGKYTKQWNGYFILLIICVGSTVISALITQWDNKKNGSQMSNKSNWSMQIFMIGLTGLFCFISNSSFALYLAASQVLSVFSLLVTTPLVNLTLKNFDPTKPKAKKGGKGDKGGKSGSNNTPNKVSYSRY